MRPGLWQILLIVVLVVILFGHAKIPDAMRNLANGLKTFKKEMGDDKENAPVASPTASAAAPVKKTVAQKPATKTASAKRAPKKVATPKKGAAKKATPKKAAAKK